MVADVAAAETAAVGTAGRLQQPQPAKCAVVPIVRRPQVGPRSGSDTVAVIAMAAVAAAAAVG